MVVVYGSCVNVCFLIPEYIPKLKTTSLNLELGIIKEFSAHEK